MGYVSANDQVTDTKGDQVYLRRCRLHAVKNATNPFKMLLIARKICEGCTERRG
jgi:hypothetical protein